MRTKQTQTKGVKLGSLSDPELVEAFRSGNDDALAVLYERYAYRLRAVAYTILRDSELAEDAVQSAFCDSIESVRVRRVQIKDFRRWITTLVRNRARRTVKLCWRKRTTLFSELPSRQPAQPSSTATEQYYLDPRLLPDEECHNRLLIERVVKATNTLPPCEKKAVILGNFMDLDLPAIARRMKVRKDTAKWYGRRGRKLIRDQFAGVLIDL